jgi:hypothetical protein
MHVSSKLRIEASKVFWAKQNAYFLVEAQWLLEEAYPGYTLSYVAFTTQVQNVAVQYRPLASRTICPRPDGILNIQRSRITGFWAALRQRFPIVKKVILNRTEESASSEDDKEPFTMALQLLLEACLHDIECSVLIFEKRKPQYNANTTSFFTVE